MSSVSGKIYKFVNRLEAKLAGLKHGCVEINQVPTSYLISKKPIEAPTLILLHGFSADKYIWNRFAKHISEDFNLLIPDMLGHGDTPFNKNNNYSVPNQVKHILALADSLGIKTFIPVGNSMGGMMVAQMMKVAAARIDQAVLIDPAGAKSEFANYMHQSKHNPFVHNSKSDFFEFYRTSMFRPPFIPKFILNHVAQTYIHRQPELAQMFGDFFNINDFFTDKISFDSASTFLIWGEKDELLPLADAKLWENILSTTTTVYKNVGHMPMVEAPKKCALDIKRFICANSLS